MSGLASRQLAWWRRPGRHPLSREGRDTLWLLAVLSLIMLLHATRLPWWANVGALLAVAWRAQLAWRDGALPQRWLLLFGLAASMLLTIVTYRTLFGREAGVTLVTLLASLKTLELRARRDAFVVTALGTFLILTQFLYAQGPLVALLMAVAFLGLLSSLVLAQRPLGRPTILSALGTAARSVAMGLPVMVALYLFFPRLGPLWQVPVDASRRTGLSDRIELGQMADLANDDGVAMRVHFEGPAPPRHDLYFRGPVLEQFDGRSWLARSPIGPQSTLSPRDDESFRLPRNSPSTPTPALLRYQVTLEPTHTYFVPLLDGTAAAGPLAPATEPQLFRQALSWRAHGAVNERIQIEAEALRQYVSGDPELPPAPAWSLQLPAFSNLRTLMWARRWRQDQGLAQADGMALTMALLRHIRQNNYRYTLQVRETTDEPAADPIDRFWLDRRSGFCEHFASSFVFIMRSWGIPSRVVIGFQGAEFNPVDGLHVVRNSDAHAWAEIWLPHQGWLRVDPTSAVAPDRIDKPRQTAPVVPGLTGQLSSIEPALRNWVRQYMDAGNHRWNVWVLQYSRHHQMDLLKQWGMREPDWLDLLRLCAVVLTGCGLAGLVWLWWSRPVPRANVWRRPMRQVHHQLRSLGLPAPALPAPASPLAWMSVITQHLPAHKHADDWASLTRILHELDALRYGPQTLPSESLKAQIRQLTRELAATVKRLRKHPDRLNGNPSA